MKPMQLRESGLLVVDVQIGFTTLCPQELPVPGGLEIVPQVNRLLTFIQNQQEGRHGRARERRRAA